MDKEIDLMGLSQAVYHLSDNLFDVVSNLRQIAKIPDTDELRSACFEMRRLAIDALFLLGAETNKQIEEKKQQENQEKTPCDADDDKKVYYEIRLGVYSKGFNVKNVNDFRDWMWNSGASGRCEMCGPVPGTGDHREFGHYTMRCPVERDFFESVLKLFEEKAKKDS